MLVTSYCNSVIIPSTQVENLSDSFTVNMFDFLSLFVGEEKPCCKYAENSLSYFVV